MREIEEELNSLEKKGEKKVIVDAPTLIENDLHKDMVYVILVWVDSNTQLQRVRSRDSLSREDAINRINAQMPLDKKKDFSNIIIENNDTLLKTKVQVESLVEFLKAI
jgi:dephospho-CoA kinase